MPAIKIYDKLTSLRYIFLYQVWLFTRPKFSRKFIQRADVLHTVCFPACLLKICAKCVEGQCRNFFSWSTLHAWIFFHLIFPCMNFFFGLFGLGLPTPTESRYITCILEGKSLSVKLMSGKQNMRYWPWKPNKDMDKIIHKSQHIDCSILFADFNMSTCYFCWSGLYRSSVLRHIRLRSFAFLYGPLHSLRNWTAERRGGQKAFVYALDSRFPVGTG